MMDVNEIRNYLPHRYPFLLVDRVVELTPGESIVAYKNVTVNEPFFNGHFPDHPVMPGVLIVEAMAQAAGILGFKTMDKTPEDGSIYVFAGIDKARFRTRVGPNDKVHLFSTVISEKKGIWKFDTRAEVDNKVVCSASILCADRKA